MDQQNLPGTIRNEVSIGEWMITLLISFLPVIGWIMLFVWAFGDASNPSKKNWAIATLIWVAIFTALGIIFLIMFWAMFASMFGGMNSYS